MHQLCNVQPDKAPYCMRLCYLEEHEGEGDANKDAELAHDHDNPAMACIWIMLIMSGSIIKEDLAPKQCCKYIQICYQIR